MRLRGISAVFFVSLTALAEPFAGGRFLTDTGPVEAAIASTSTQALVIWRDGTVLTANGHRLTYDAKHAAVAAVGEAGLAVWTEAGGFVTGSRLTETGAPFGPAFRIASNAAGAIAIAGGADRYLVAWPTILGDIYAAVLDAAGTPLVPAMPVTMQTAGTIEDISAASMGNTFALVWHSSSQIHATTLDDLGMPGSMKPTLVSDAGGSADITSNGSTFFAVWAGEHGLRGRNLAADGSVGRVQKLTNGSDFAPRVAWDGSAYSVAYLHSIPPRHVITVLEVFRFSTTAVPVEHLLQSSLTAVWFPSLWDIDAREGHVDLVRRWGEFLLLETASVDIVPPPRRRRAVRQ
jgi:hypothetical protein